MAIFSKTKKEVKTKEVVVPKTPGAYLQKDFLKGVLVKPRITEKATVLAEKSGVYVFEVAKDSTKPLISKAITTLYGVVPVKVSIVSVPARSIVVRGKLGTQSGFKKAYVYLKKGDKIQFA